MDDKEIARFFDCCETPSQRKFTRKLSSKAREHLVEAVVREGLLGRSVLEVGCGRGELLLELLEKGATAATGIDLGERTVEEARENARSRGLTERVVFQTGNGAEEVLPRHDIVVLDKVICCYPDWKRLVDNTSAVSSHTYAFVLPRSQGMGVTLIRAFVAMGNLAQRLKGCGFRAFVHDRRAIDEHLRKSGFVRRHLYQGPVWATLVYVRR